VTINASMIFAARAPIHRNMNHAGFRYPSIINILYKHL
jgi:hypothetical protein